MNAYDPTSPLIFIHIPKAAGTSVQQIFKLWYGDSLHINYFNEHTGALPERLDLNSLQSMSQPLVIYGHFNKLRGFGVEDYYPDIRQFITILRDPFEGAISSYYFIKKTGDNWKDQSLVPKSDLRQFLTNTPPNMLNHFPRTVTKENYRDLIEEFFIEIGVMEQLSDSVRGIANKLGMPFREDLVPHVNATERNQEYTQELRKEFEQLYPLEVEVYNYVVSRFNNSNN